MREGMSKIKILMLAGKGESSTLMFNGIKDSFLIEKIIFEERVSKKELLKRRMKKLGLATVFGQVFFMIFNNFWLKTTSKARIDQIKQQENLNEQRIDEALVSEVDSINSDETIRLLKEYQPDVVVVNGTRIIKKEVLDSIAAPFVNTHVGITPKYRGVHGGYWALTENDHEHCGVTVHLIDTGIDTGGILYQGTINVTDRDTFKTYPYLQMAVAIPLMKKAINDLAKKTYRTLDVDLPSKLWSHPTLLEYLKHRVLHGVK